MILVVLEGTRTSSTLPSHLLFTLSTFRDPILLFCLLPAPASSSRLHILDVFSDSEDAIDTIESLESKTAMKMLDDIYAIVKESGRECQRGMMMGPWRDVLQQVVDKTRPELVVFQGYGKREKEEKGWMRRWMEGEEERIDPCWVSSQWDIPVLIVPMDSIQDDQANIQDAVEDVNEEGNEIHEPSQQV